MTTYPFVPRHNPLHGVLLVDQFSAQVIDARDPVYTGRPCVVVAQNENSHRSRVRSCSPAAQRAGLSAGMPVHLCRHRCPSVVIVHPHTELEDAVHGEIMQILSEFSPDYGSVRPGQYGINLTRTPCARQKSAQEIAEVITARITRITGLKYIAVGMGPSPLTARVYARHARPHGIRIGDAQTARSYWASLSIHDLPGLSPRCKEKCARYGIHDVAQIHTLGKQRVLNHFGREGEKLYSLASGVDSTTVDHTVAPIRAKTTLHHDIVDRESLHAMLRLTVDKLCFTLKKRRLAATTIRMTLRYSDNKTCQRTLSLPAPDDSFPRLVKLCTPLFFGMYTRRVALRSLTLIAGRLHSDAGQMDLFDTEEMVRKKSVTDAITAIRSRTRFSMVVNACNVGRDKNEYS